VAAPAPLGAKNRQPVPPPELKAAAPPAKLRVLVCSHSHPKITHGGAEIAAFRLFSELDSHPDTEAWFLGCNTQPGTGRDGVAITQPFSSREYVYSTGGQFDWFRFANGDARFPGELEALLLELRPDIVHLHHYVNYGVEMLLTIRRTLPRARIVVTLHEYLAICNHFGQMVKRGHFSLCDHASLSACRGCYPEHEAADFFMRERYIKLFFDHVDHFVSPSRFLAERYTAWGIPADKISMIENITAPAESLPLAVEPLAQGVDTAPLRIGFFGQISKLKGIGVLLEAAAILAETATTKISFDIFGDYKGQPQPFQDEFLAQLAKVSRNVNYRGAYRQDRVDRLMRGVDAVLVPSIWWENSPVVIQEAFRNNRPVICSDIGGMAEKVRDKVDGHHFPVGSGLELSYLLLRLYEDRSLLEVLGQHLSLYAWVASAAQTAARV
jgi:glycosyltransferase involved in cell wall biosynthesis